MSVLMLAALVASVVADGANATPLVLVHKTVGGEADDQSPVMEVKTWFPALPTICCGVVVPGWLFCSTKIFSVPLSELTAGSP
jgi:hypothetical protein